MFQNDEEQNDMEKLLDEWTVDPNNVKSAFIKFRDNLYSKENAILSFKSRPGVSYSLRGTVENQAGEKRPLFVMVDIIDDEPESRWLSVCFFEDMLTDPDEEGDLIPGGLLGEDGYCFDLYDYDEHMISYIEQRINEAHAKMSGI